MGKRPCSRWARLPAAAYLSAGGCAADFPDARYGDGWDRHLDGDQRREYAFRRWANHHRIRFERYFGARAVGGESQMVILNLTVDPAAQPGTTYITVATGLEIVTAATC